MRPLTKLCRPALLYLATADDKTGRNVLKRVRHVIRIHSSRRHSASRRPRGHVGHCRAGGLPAEGWRRSSGDRALQRRGAGYRRQPDRGMAVCRVQFRRSQRHPGRRHHYHCSESDAVCQRLADGETGSARLAGLSRPQGRQCAGAGHRLGGGITGVPRRVSRRRGNGAVHQCARDGRRRLERGAFWRAACGNRGSCRVVLFHQHDRAAHSAAAAVHHYLGFPVRDGDQVHRRGRAGIPGTGVDFRDRREGRGIFLARSA